MLRLLSVGKESVRVVVNIKDQENLFSYTNSDK